MGRGLGYFNGTSTYKAKLCVLRTHDAYDMESYCSYLTYLVGQRSCKEAISFPLRTSSSCAHSVRRDSE